MKAVILAAGEGARLRAEGEASPKPLLLLGGLPLLERVIRNAARAGVDEFLVVVGHRGEELVAALQTRLREYAVRWIHHDRWRLGNGSSALAARLFVGNEPFLVLMADHLIFDSTLRDLIAATPKSPRCMMAVDRKRGVITDPEDAMKVRLRGDRVVDVGKKLEPYDAIDIGAAVCHPIFFDELEHAASHQEGRCTHSDGMRALAEKDLLIAHDVGADRWEDVDNQAARQAATKILLESLRKPSDGLMSRLIERRFSLAITRHLANTPLTPNQVSLGVMLVGAVAGALFAQPGWGVQVVAALVFWCGSFLDGCDGELARLKFQESRLGGWLDLWVDNVVHSMVFFGMGVGLYRETGDPLWIRLGSAAVVGVVLSVGWASWKTFRTSRGGGPLFVSVFGSERGREDRGAIGCLRWLADALSRRDFIFGVIFLAILGWLPYFLWAAAIGANLYFLILVLIEVSERSTASPDVPKADA